MSTVTLYPSTDSAIGSDWSKHGFSGSYSAALATGNMSEFASIPDSSSGSNCGLYLVLGSIPGNVSSISAVSFSFDSAMSSTKSGGGNLYATVWNSALTSKLVATTDLGVNDSTTFASGSSSATLSDATIADWNGAILELSTGGSSNSNSDEICLIGVVLTCTLSSTPGVPTGLSAAYASSTSVALTWTQGSGTVTDNEVQYSTNGTSGWTTVDVGSAATSHTVTGLTPGQLYFFQVNAGDSGSYSSYCSPVPWVCGSNWTGQTTNNAFQNNSGTVTIADSTDDCGINDYLGFLFEDVAITQYAVIAQANLYLYVPSGSQNASLGLDCQLSASPAAFTATSDDISNRTLTGNGLSMNVTSWSTGWNSSPNMQASIKAVVNQSGWSENDSLAVIIVGGGAVDEQSLTVVMASGSSTEAAILAILTTTDDGTCHFDQSDSVFETSVHRGAKMVAY
jgi:Fibronectin type III domain